jgi:hypothetical protein
MTVTAIATPDDFDPDDASLNEMASIIRARLFPPIVRPTEQEWQRDVLAGKERGRQFVVDALTNFNARRGVL